MYRIGLTLSGGGAKGLAHAGVLKALEEYGITKEFYEANIKRVLSQP